jgi:hypothetical protein
MGRCSTVAALTEFGAPRLQTADTIAKSVPRAIVDVVFAVRQLHSAPARIIELVRVPSTLRPLVPDAELLSTSDSRMSNAIAEVLPVAYARQLVARMTALGDELAAFVSNEDVDYLDRSAFIQLREIAEAAVSRHS